MPLRPLVFALTASCCALHAAGANAAAWSPVPGAQEVEIDLASLRQAGTRVTAWLRWRGRPPHALPEMVQTAGAPRVTRTAVLTEFDCGVRRMRALGANTYDAGGAPLSMSTIPGPLLPVQGQGDDTAWAYDAVCEAARAAGRF